MTASGDSGALQAASPTRRDPWYWVRLAVGVGLLAALVVMVGPAEMLRIARGASPGWTVAVVAMALVWLGLGALNMWLLLSRVASVPFRAFGAVYLTSWAMSLVLPGQLGDAAQVVLLRRHAVNMSTSAAVYVVDKAISLAWMVVVAVYGLGLYLPEVWRGYILVIGAVTAGLAGLGVVVLGRIPARPGGLVGRAQRFVRHMLEQIWSLRGHGGAIALNAGLTVVKWGVMATMYLGAFHALGGSIDVVAVATIPVMSSLIGYLPITVGGAGTVEWTAVTLFARVGAAGPLVVSVYLFLRATLVVCAFALLVGLRWRRRRPDQA